MEGAAGPRQLSEGTMLDDKYRIERLLATGGMGAVYVGTHTRLRKRVAIKVLSPQHNSPPMIERFRREAITASQIGHEGIAQVTDLGTSSAGEPFLVMEYLEGESLASRLRTAGRLSIEDACEISCAILAPLGAAHRAGIIHRDLKPDNVFLVRQSRGETVKLLDFGISRVSGVDPELRLTMTGLVLGTPLYMSPEQARGESNITTAADIYAFGVVLYEMLVGEVPILAENYNQLMYRVTMSEFLPPRQRRPTVPVELEAIVLRAMAHAPADRPGSAGELERQLLAFCRPAFREHANGPISTPRLLTASPWSIAQGGDMSASGIDRADYAMFEGTTISDSHTDDVHPPDVPDQDLAEGPLGVVWSQGTAAPSLGDRLVALDDAAIAGDDADQTALHRTTPPASANRAGRFSTAKIPGHRSRPRHFLIGAAIAVVGAVTAFTLASALTDDKNPSPAMALVQEPIAGRFDGVRSEPAVTQPAAQPVTQLAQPAGGDDARTAEDHPAQGSANITLRLAVEPSGAAIALDGARVTGTELVVPRDQLTHQLRITAAGHVGYEAAIRFDENQRLVVQLKRAAGMIRGKDGHKDRTRPERTERIDSRSPYE